MNLQTDRRHDPYPLTWEIPVGVLTLWLVLAALGTHLGRGLANLAAGAGWTWPAGRALFTSLPSTLTGNATAGLHPAPELPAPPSSVLGWVIATQLVLLTALVAATVVILRRWGPGRIRGMATPTEAELTLGLTRLRAASRIIRPDLYNHPSTPTGGHRGNHQDT